MRILAIWLLVIAVVLAQQQQYQQQRYPQQQQQQPQPQQQHYPNQHRRNEFGTQAQIISRILSEYDATTRPPLRDHATNTAIFVMTNIFINRIQWGSKSAEVDMYLRQQWQDGRLKYEVNTHENIDEVRLPSAKKIWEPDTYFTSAREVSRGSASSGNSKSVVVEPSGFVRSSERITIDLPYTYGSSFPFTNSRQITIKLGSYNYDIDDIVYVWSNSPPLVHPIEVSPDLMHGEITFEEASAGDCVGNYTVGTYSCIDALVTFHTCTTTSLTSWFLPTLLLVFASWLHFWVPGSWSVPRTASAALPFLILVGYYLFNGSSAFGYGRSSWLVFCLIITFFSLVEYFLVICCGPRRSIRYKTLGTQEEHPMGAAKETLEVAYNQGCGSFRANNGIDIISRVAFPLITVVFMVIYFVFLV